MIGLFIGSFNPITKAHIDICLKLQNDFSKIVLVPVSSKDKSLIDINSRVSMLRIIQNKYPFIEISDIMKNYSYLNYRVINILRDTYGKLNIIMGSDLLEKFTDFDNYDYLLKNYFFTIVPRGKTNVKKLIKEKYSKYVNQFNIIDYHSNISSSLVKEKLKNNQDTSKILDQDILNYIKENDLY